MLLELLRAPLRSTPPPPSTPSPALEAWHATRRAERETVVLEANGVESSWMISVTLDASTWMTSVTVIAVHCT